MHACTHTRTHANTNVFSNRICWHIYKKYDYKISYAYLSSSSALFIGMKQKAKYKVHARPIFFYILKTMHISVKC